MVLVEGCRFTRSLCDLGLTFDLDCLPESFLLPNWMHISFITKIYGLLQLIMYLYLAVLSPLEGILQLINFTAA